MTGLWNDFNSAQDNTNIIPKGTLAKVRLTIRPGGFDDPRRAGPAATPPAARAARSISPASSPCSRAPTPGARSSR
jgi:hypothetical protein